MPNLNQLPDGGDWREPNKTSLSARSSSFSSANSVIQHHSHLSSSHSSSSSGSVSAAERRIQEKQQLLRHLPSEDREGLINSKPSKGKQLQPPSHSANHLPHPASSPGVMSPNAREHWTSGSTSQPKPQPTPIASNHRVYGSADAEERRHAGSSFKPKSTLTSTPSHSANHLPHPASSPGVMSADAREHWTSGSTSHPKPKPTPIASNHQHYGSADAEERRHVGLSFKPQPTPGSADDLPEARKALQQKHNSSQNMQKVNKGGVFSAELRDLQRETSVVQARVDASEADKKLQNFSTQSQHSKSQNRGITEEIRSDLAQQAYSAKEIYMNSQGLDSSGQPIKLTPPPPAPEQPKQDNKSLLDRGKDFFGGYVNFQKDVDIGAAKAVWDMGKGLGSLAKSGLEFQRDVYTNPEKAQQTLSNFSGNLQEIAKHPGQVWDALKQPYVDAINSGHPGEALGRGFVDIGSFFVPGGVLGKAGTAARVAETAEIASKAATAARVAGEGAEATASRIPAKTKFGRPSPLRDEGGRFAPNPNSPLTRQSKHKSVEYRRAQDQLKRETIDDPKAPRHMRAWLEQEKNVRGDNPRKWRNPKGYDTGHSDPNDNTRLRWETSSQNRSRGGRFGR